MVKRCAHLMIKAAMDFSMLNIHHVNANSKSKKHYTDNYLNVHKPDIMKISETKLNAELHAKFDNYIMHCNDRTTKNSGGTAMLIRDNIKAEMLMNPKNCNIECTAIKVLLANNKHITIVAAFMPNQALKVDDIDSLFAQFGKNNIIFAGDLNAKQHGKTTSTTQTELCYLTGRTIILQIFVLLMNPHAYVAIQHHRLLTDTLLAAISTIYLPIKFSRMVF